MTMRQVVFGVACVLTTVLALLWAMVAAVSGLRMVLSMEETLTMGDWKDPYSQWKMWYLSSQLVGFTQVHGTVAVMLMFGAGVALHFRLHRVA